MDISIRMTVCKFPPALAGGGLTFPIFVSQKWLRSDRGG